MATEQQKTTENKAAENKPLEKVDAEKIAEAKAEAKGETPALVDDRLKEADLPKRKDAALLPEGRGTDSVDADEADPNRSWTIQAAEVEDAKARRAFVTPEDRPGQYVNKAELPTAEGLKDIGVTDPGAYLAAVPVKK